MQTHTRNSPHETRTLYRDTMYCVVSSCILCPTWSLIKGAHSIQWSGLHCDGQHHYLPFWMRGGSGCSRWMVCLLMQHKTHDLKSSYCKSIAERRKKKPSFSVMVSNALYIYLRQPAFHIWHLFWRDDWQQTERRTCHHS